VQRDAVGRPYNVYPQLTSARTTDKNKERQIREKEREIDGTGVHVYRDVHQREVGQHFANIDDAVWLTPDTYKR